MPLDFSENDFLQIPTSLFWERDIVFSKNRFNWVKYEKLKIWWIWKIEIRSEELVDGYQTVPYQPGALFFGGRGGAGGEGSQLSGSVSNLF